MSESIQIRTLKLAVGLADDPRALARQFGIREERLLAMLNGAAIPTWVFLRAVDYIAGSWLFSLPGFDGAATNTRSRLTYRYKSARRSLPAGRQR